MSQDTQEGIRIECNLIRDMLLQKNADYGDSALNPVRIFSKADTDEQLNVRLDDKLSRIATIGERLSKLVGAGVNNIQEDTILDLIGYLILKRVHARNSNFDPKKNK